MNPRTPTVVPMDPASVEARFSIIIPTKYRPEVVERTMGTVFRQSLPPWQVIVVDQSSTEETRARVERQFTAAGAQQWTRLSYLYDPAIRGAAAARNRGMDLAEGDTWLFLDDDVLLETDFLKRLLDAYRLYPHATGVSGVFTNYRPPSRVHRVWSWIFLRGPFHDERQPIYWRADLLRNSAPRRVTKFTGALMSFRAEAVRKLRFDENIRKTGAEDVDFCARLGRDAVLLIAPAARLFHERAPAGRSASHWVQNDLEMAYYLYKRNWNTSFRDKLCFAWLTVGYAVATTLACVRRKSFAPWRGIVEGIRLGGVQAVCPPSNAIAAAHVGRPQA